MSNNPRSSINCHKDFAILAHTFKLNISILDKIKAEFGMEPKPIGESTLWINDALLRALQLCEAYKASDESSFPTKDYVAEINKGSQWELQFVAAVSKFQEAVNKAPKDPASGKKKPDDNSKKDATTSIGKILDTIKGIYQPPKTAKPVPATGHPKLNELTKQFDVGLNAAPSSPEISILEALLNAF